MTAGDGDALALSLFRQWIAATHEYDGQYAATPDDADCPAGDLMTEIEDRILEISGGAVSLALKTHFAVRQNHAAWTGEARLLRIREYFDDDPDWEIRFAVALLRDAAAVVPEIRELAAPVLHEDAALIDAEIEIRWARIMLAQPVNPRLAEIWGDEWPERRKTAAISKPRWRRCSTAWRRPRPRLPVVWRSRLRSWHERRRSTPSPSPG